MAGSDPPPPPPDPFSTQIHTDLPVLEVEASRKTLEEARVKEQREQEKFRLEKQTATELSEYHQRKWKKRLEDEMPACTLNFDTPCQVQISDPLEDGSSQPATAPGATTRPIAGATAAGASQPPPNANPTLGQPRIFLATREVTENNMLQETTPMDNIIASAAALTSIDPTADNTLGIAYAKNLLNKCIQQQGDSCDSHGRVYSRSSGSRAASTGNRTIIAAATAAPAANLQNYPPPGQVQPQGQPRNDQPVYSSNEPPHQ
jgi:hypothetical protein